MLILGECMKTIGVILRKTLLNNKIYYVMTNEILKYLKDVNILGIIINENIDLKYIKSNINICDGIILPGGSIDDDKTKEIIRYLHEINKPTLGICLGMQQMNLALGGDLSKLHTNNHMSKMKYVHSIFINKASKLYNILKKDNILVNSRHLFEIKNPTIYISAISDDNVIEAIEDKNKKFFIGVQWHPESLKNDINSKLLINEFIKNI